MNKLLLLLFTITLAEFTISQDVKYYGAFEQGNLVIVESENIEWAWINDQKLSVDNEKVFTLGFDAKETDSKILKFKHSGGKVTLKKINLPIRKYNVQKINNTKQQFSTTPDSLKVRIKREREIAKLAQSKIGELQTPLFRKGFIRPIKGGRISSVFGSQRILNGIPKNMHNGLDIAVPRGTPVLAMADAVVNLTTDNFYYAGNYIVLDHGQGLNSMYLHLSEILVEEGQRVNKGDVIGKVGTTGRSTGPHLHWGVQWYSKRIDPEHILNIKL